MGLAASIVVIFALLCVSAFFAGSETALTAASQAKLHSLEKQGDKRAKLVNRIRSNKERMIGALLLGNTLFNIMCSALATSVAIRLFGEAGVIYATIIITIFVLIFAEVLPKTFAFHHADKMSMALSPVVSFVIWIITPVVAMISFVVRMMLRLVGTNTAHVRIGTDLDMLRGAIEMHRGPEEETNEQRAMLRSILELGDVTVEEVMTHRKKMFTLDSSEPLETLLPEIIDSPHTRLPIWKDEPDNIIGIIHVKSLLKELQKRGGRLDTLSIETLAIEPWFVPNTTALSDQLKAFRKRREHVAMVVDEYGTLMGMVTLEDVIEEIVGEIDDEMDEIVAGVRKQPNGSYLLDGTVTIRDMKREFEWELPDADYSTVAGLILYEAQMIPEPGQSFTFFGFRFDVVKRQRNQITLVRVTPPPKKEETQQHMSAGAH